MTQVAINRVKASRKPFFRSREAGKKLPLPYLTRAVRVRDQHLPKMRFPAGIVATSLLCSAIYVLAVPSSDVTTISQAAASGDQLLNRSVASGCSGKAWPYYESDCVRDLRQSTGRARAVRVVSTDRLPPSPGHQVALRFVDPSPTTWALPIVLRFGFDG